MANYVSTLSGAEVEAALTAALNGAAKARVLLNGIGTAAIYESYNVASLTDIDVGRYDVAFTNVFATADYTPCTCGALGRYVSTRTRTTQLAGSVELNCQNQPGALADTDLIGCGCIGDLA